MSISTRSRFEVFKRDNFTCQYCGRKPPVVILEVDHIHPVSKGGSSDQINLLTACFECNRGKAAIGLQDRLSPLADQIALEKERHEQVKAYNRFLASIRRRAEKDFFKISDRMVELAGQDPSKYTVPEGWCRSIKTFVSRLPVEEVLDAVEIAHDRFSIRKYEGYNFKAFKYFCGICWKKIKGEPPYAG